VKVCFCKLLKLKLEKVVCNLGEKSMTAFLSNQGCLILTVNTRFLPQQGDLLHELVERLGQSPKVPSFELDVEPLDKKALDEVVARLKSYPSVSRVLLAGAHLEDQISVIALQLLAEGFDVTLLQEWLVSRKPAFGQTFESRLVQAGAVQSTLRQMLYQWSAVENEAHVQAELRAMIEAIDLPKPASH
jgi:hypothetical protein